jgi:hypothetical protein
VRSRCYLSGKVRGFGHDLAIVSFGHAADGTFTRPSPSVHALPLPVRSCGSTARGFLGRERDCVVVRNCCTARLVGGAGATARRLTFSPHVDLLWLAGLCILHHFRNASRILQPCRLPASRFTALLSGYPFGIPCGMPSGTECLQDIRVRAFLAISSGSM